MTNFQFIKTQFKNLIIPLVIFFLFFLILSCFPLLFMKKFSPNVVINNNSNEKQVVSMGGSGIMHYINGFGINYILMFSFSITLIYILLKKNIKIDKLHVYDLLLSFSVMKMINLKLLVLFVSIIIINFNIMFLQLFFLSLAYDDFQHAQQLRLVVNNFFLFFLGILWTAIIWFIACLFNKDVFYFTISLLISVIFLVCGVMSFDNSNMPNSDNFELTENVLKYFTIISLFNGIIIFSKNEYECLYTGNMVYKINRLLEIKTNDYVGQMPVLIITSITLFVAGNGIFLKKNKIAQ